MSDSTRWSMLACVLAMAPAAFAQKPCTSGPCQDGQAVEAAEYTASPTGIAPETDGESLKHLARNIFLDQKTIWTSPFHITRQNAPLWLTFGAITGVMIATDHRASQQLPNTGDQLAISRDISQVGAVYTLIPITGGIYLSGFLTHNAKLRETGVLAGEALVDGLIVSEVLKTATGRQRPLEGDGGGHFFHGSDGFPSGHTLGSFALASVIAHQYPDHKAVVILAYGLATVVGASRFSARQHYGSDVVAGGVIGWFIGRHVFETHQEGRASRAKSAWLTPQVIPTVQPSDRNYGITLAWHP